MKIILLFLLVISVNARADIRLLNFNTMCDICKGSFLPKYHKRIQGFQKIIKNYNPDIISLQEFRTLSHLEKTFSQQADYQIITYQKTLLNYPDASIVYKSSRFELVKKGTLWLGPNQGRFSWGWKYAIPRILVWAQLKDKIDGKEYMIMSTHLDNRIENLAGSAHFIQNFIKTINIPIIFAADSNITFEMPEYKILSQHLKNAYHLSSFFYLSEAPEHNQDLCYLKKGKIFPNCMVEHVLLSAKHNWKVTESSIDLTKIENTSQFLSDHRAFFYNIQLN